MNKKELKSGILGFIPGFRTGAVWKMIIASLYYFITLLFLFIEFGLFLFVVSIPFFIMNLITAIRHKNKIYFLVTGIAFVIMIVSFAIPSSKNDKTNIPYVSPVVTATPDVSTQTPIPIPTIDVTPTPVPVITEVPAETSEPKADIKNEMQTFLNTLKEESSNTIVYVEAYTDKIFFVSITNSWYMWSTEQKEYIVNSLYTALKNKLCELTGDNDPIVTLTVLDETQKIIAKSKTSGGVELK